MSPIDTIIAVASGGRGEGALFVLAFLRVTVSPQKVNILNFGTQSTRPANKKPLFGPRLSSFFER